jgi:sulfate transport system permease protein
MGALALGWRKPSVVPGFGITLGLTLWWLSLIVLIPLAGLFIKAASLGLPGFWDVVTSPRVVAALRLSFSASFAAAVINGVFGLVVAWILVRYDFPGRRLVEIRRQDRLHPARRAGRPRLHRPPLRRAHG